MDRAAPGRGLSRDALMLLGLFAAAFLLRLPSWWATDIDWDEGAFALAGREIAEGRLPYLGFFDIKPLGLWVLNGLAQLIGGPELMALRALGAACVGITAGLLFLLARGAAGSGSAGLAAALLFLAFSTDLTGLVTHTEILMAPFATGAALLAWRALARPATGTPYRLLAAMAALFAVELAIKPVAVIWGSVLFVLVLAHWWRTGLLPARRGLAAALLYAAICGLPFFLAAAIYAAAGHFAIFWYSYFGFKSAYVGVGGGVDLAHVFRNILRIILVLWPLLLLALWLPARWLRDRRLLPAGFAALWLGADLLAASASLQFFQHYFLLTLPPLCLAAALALDDIGRRLVVAGRQRAAILALAGFVALIPLVPYLHARPWLSLTRPDALAQLAMAVRANTPPGGTVFLTGVEPIVYFLAGARLATPHVFPTLLFGGQRHLAPVDPDREIARVMAARPALVVVERSTWPGLTPSAVATLKAGLGDYRPVGEVVARGRRFELLTPSR